MWNVEDRGRPQELPCIDKLVCFRETSGLNRLVNILREEKSEQYQNDRDNYWKRRKWGWSGVSFVRLFVCLFFFFFFKGGWTKWHPEVPSNLNYSLMWTVLALQAKPRHYYFLLTMKNRWCLETLNYFFWSMYINPAEFPASWGVGSK